MSVAVRTLPVQNEEESVLALLHQVCKDGKSAASPGFDFSGLHESILQLEKFIFSTDGDEATASTILEHLAPEMLAGLNDAYCFWETMHESQFAESFLKNEASLADYFLNDRFDGLVRRELSLLSGLHPRRILLIGSGPLPISAIHLHCQTAAPVDCVVRDPDTLALAEQTLAKCQLTDSVRVFRNKDPGYALCDYDLIVLELLAKSRKAILRDLRKHCQPGCQILCRTSYGLRRLIYAATHDRDLRGFQLKRKLVADGSQTISTHLIEAARSAATDLRMRWLREIDSPTAAQLLLLMNRTLVEETTIGFPGPIDDATGYALMQQLDTDVKSGHRHLLVAERDEVIVGQLILTPNSSPNHRHIVELTRGTIDPSFRGAGLALRAFQEVAHKCEELGREVICLDVRAGTMAAMWWQHFGFKPYGFLADYSRVGEKRYEGLYLTQTTAELTKRLEELAGSPASAAADFRVAELP